MDVMKSMREIYTAQITQSKLNVQKVLWFQIGSPTHRIVLASSLLWASLRLYSTFGFVTVPVLLWASLRCSQFISAFDVGFEVS